MPTLSHIEVTIIEEKTRLQGKCLPWFEQRCGRITGSVISKVVKCKSASEAARLSTKIAESPLVLFESWHRRTAAMRYGTAHEDGVRRQYVQHQMLQHTNFQCRNMLVCLYMRTFRMSLQVQMASLNVVAVAVGCLKLSVRISIEI